MLEGQNVDGFERSLPVQSTAECIERIMCRDPVALAADCFTIDPDLSQLLAQFAIRGDAFFDFKNASQHKRSCIADWAGGSIV